jgi:hypothetical protein
MRLSEAALRSRRRWVLLASTGSEALEGPSYGQFDIGFAPPVSQLIQ